MFIFLPIIFSCFTSIIFYYAYKQCFCTSLQDSDRDVACCCQPLVVLISYIYFQTYARTFHFLLNSMHIQNPFDVQASYRWANSLPWRPQLALSFVRVLKGRVDTEQREINVVFMRLGSEASLLGFKFLFCHLTSYRTFRKNLSSL